MNFGGGHYSVQYANIPKICVGWLLSYWSAYKQKVKSQWYGLRNDFKSYLMFNLFEV